VAKMETKHEIAMELVIWTFKCNGVHSEHIKILQHHYEKMGRFAIGFAIGFLSCNDHLQVIAI